MKFNVGDLVKREYNAAFRVKELDDDGRYWDGDGRLYYETELKAVNAELEKVYQLIAETQATAQEYERTAGQLPPGGHHHERLKSFYAGRLHALRDLKREFETLMAVK